MRRGALLVAVAVACAAGAAPARAGGGSHHGDATPAPPGAVTISGNAFRPASLSVVVGDRVTWRNEDFVEHVVADDDAFGSSRLATGETYAHTFAAAGSFAYRCTIHPFMRGKVDAAPIVLSPPPAPVLLGATTTLHGRAQAGVATVALARDGSSAPPALATVAADGTFAARVRIDAAGRWRATAGALASPPVIVEVRTQQRVLLRVAGDELRVRTVPPRPRARVVIERWWRERFAWHPIARLRLDGRGRARVRLPNVVRAGGRIQAVLPAAGGLPRGVGRIRLR